MLGDFILNVVLAILSTYLVFEYYKNFFKLNGNPIRNKVIAGLYCIWQIMSLFVFQALPAWLRLILSILFVILVSICFTGDFIGKVVFAVIYNALWMLMELFVGSCFMLAGLGLESSESAGSALSKILLLLLIKALQLFFKHESMNVLSWKDNALLMLFPMGSMFFTYQLFVLSDKVGTTRDHIISLTASVMVFVMNLIMFIVYIKLSNSLKLEREKSIYQLELDLYNEHMKEKENAMIEFRKRKHDLKHQLIFLLELLKDKEYAQLQDYVEELVDLKSLEGFTIADSENSLIDALINYKYETAKRQGIDFQVRLDIPIHFSLANSDLCVILGNALDNAMEANIGADIPNPFIKLNMRYDKGNLIIILENSFDGYINKDDKGVILSRKKDKAYHGIGLMSIQNTLVKYRGFMNTEISDKIYKLTIVMHSDTEEAF